MEKITYIISGILLCFGFVVGISDLITTKLENNKLKTIVQELTDDNTSLRTTKITIGSSLNPCNSTIQLSTYKLLKINLTELIDKCEREKEKID